MTDRNGNGKFRGASYSAKRRRIQESVEGTWKLISDECSTGTSPQTSDEGVSYDGLTSCFADATVADDAFDDRNRGPEEECEGESTNLDFVLSDTMSSADTSFCSSDSESDNDCQSQADCPSVGTKIAQWATKHNISQSALKDLLDIIRPQNPGLPRDPRTPPNSGSMYYNHKHQLYLCRQQQL